MIATGDRFRSVRAALLNELSEQAIGLLLKDDLLPGQ